MKNESFEKAMKLAVLSGLKVALGPAMLKTSRRDPDRTNWIMASLGEMVLDKTGILPSRYRLPLLIPHAISGGWVARESMRADGYDDPWAAPMGAAVAAGVATIAPMVRKTMNKVLGVPDMVLGVAEDYCALRLGTEAVGLSMEEVKETARESVEEFSGQIKPLVQSIGAGSM
jgi:hypothetical protein